MLEALFGAGEPISAEQIAGGLGGRLPSSDLASVYRNLETLERVGLVRHFHLGHGPGLYALAEARTSSTWSASAAARRAVDPAELDGVRELIERDVRLPRELQALPDRGHLPELPTRGKD